MIKYHINPDTGEFNPCDAKISCRFGENAPHFNNPEDARKAASEQLRREFHGNLKKLSKTHKTDNNSKNQNEKQIRDESVSAIINFNGETPPNSEINKTFSIYLNLKNSQKTESNQTSVLNSNHGTKISSSEEQKYIDLFRKFS